MFILRIHIAPPSLILSLFIWLCAGLLSCSSFVFKLASGLLSLLAFAVLITYSVKTTSSSYYNKFGQESRTASPAFFPSLAQATIRGATGWPHPPWASMPVRKTVSHPLIAAFDLSRLSYSITMYWDWTSLPTSAQMSR